MKYVVTWFIASHCHYCPLLSSLPIIQLLCSTLCCHSDSAEAWLYVDLTEPQALIYTRVQVWMHAYRSMYRPCRPTAISGYMRVISGYTMAQTYQAILPLFLYTVEQEPNQMKQSDSHSRLLKTLLGWAENEYYCMLRMAIHKETKKSACPTERLNNIKSNLQSNHQSTFRDGTDSAPDSVLMGASTNCIFRTQWWSSIVHGISIISGFQPVVLLTGYWSICVFIRALVQCFRML